MTEIEISFGRDMIEIYRRAEKELGYRASRFIQLLTKWGCVETALSLVSKAGGTDGFAVLWEHGRLDLSVENLVLQERYVSLFTEEVREICRNRLRQ